MLRRRHTAAQSLVEFALVIPMFLLLLLALIDFGRLLFTYGSVANGARELSRSMTITGNSAVTAIAAFNNLTIIAGGTSPATSITLQPLSGTGSGSISCASATSPMCTIEVTTTSVNAIPPAPPTPPYNVTLTSYSGATGTATYTAASPTFQFNPTSTGDFVMVTWLALSPSALMHGYIQLCQLPITNACTLPNFPTGPPATTRETFSDGFVQVDVGYNFQFNPLFQNKLTGIVDVSFMRPSSLVTTSVRTYAE